MDDTRTSSYEVAFYIKTEDAAPVKAAVSSVRGEVLEERAFEKVKLEFPIRKESFVFLGVLRATLPSEAVSSLDRALTLTPGVLRHLITLTPKLPPEDKREERRMGESRRPQGPRMSAPKEPSILTNEAIEKKIEEILQ